MMSWRRVAISVALLALAAVLTRCSEGTPGSPSPSETIPGPAPTGTRSTVAGSAPRGLFSTAYDPVEGPNGGEVVIGSTREAGTFNPYYVTETADAFVAAATWATLVVVTGDGRYAPDLAERIPTVENGGVRVPGDPGDAMTVTWMLRERSNGRMASR